MVGKRKKKSRTPSKAPSTSPTIKGVVSPLKLGHGGCLVETRNGNFTVSSAVPSEKVMLSPFETRGQTPRARIVDILTPAKERTVAPCSLLERCGGCMLQEMTYQAQLEAKHVALKKVLSPLCDGKLVSPIAGLPEPFGYRTRLLMPASPTRGSSPPIMFGFYGRGTTQLVSAPGCPVQHPLTLSTLAQIKQVLMGTHITATRPGAKGGWLHGLALRIDPHSGRSQVTFIGRNKKMPGGKLLTERLLALPGINGIHLSINPERSSYLMGETFVHLAGHRRTGFHLGGEKFLLSPGSFFQTSATGAELLVAQVLRALPDQIRCLADLYGGVGVFSRLSRKKWKKAVIAESSPWAIGDLRHWLKKEPRTDIKIYEGRVESVMHEVFSANPDVVLLDPPRVGLHDRVVQKITREKPPVLVYVSCGIDALVRDGKQFIESGYRMDHVSAVDMFPHTSHLETVTRFVLP